MSETPARRKTFVTQGRILRGAAIEESLKTARLLRAYDESSERARHAADWEPDTEAEVLSAADAGLAENQATLAAVYLLLKSREERLLETNLDRVTELAVALAERLVGAAVEMAPEKILAMAQTALSEAKGARKARIEANPIDVDALREHTESLGAAIVVEPNAELARGSLVLHTDLGTLDARLTPQLERLARALRDALR